MFISEPTSTYKTTDTFIQLRRKVKTAKDTLYTEGDIGVGERGGVV